MTAYPDDGQLTLEVGGQKVSGWQEIRVTRGLERCPSDFDIRVTEKLPGAAQDVVILPNDVCRVKIGSDLVLTGYVERYQPTISPEAHDIRVCGRSACADIVDCMVDYRGGVINGSNLRKIAELLTAPYGVKVVALNGDGPTVPQLTINLGESPYQVIERVARYGAMLSYDNPEGNLVLAQVGTNSMGSGIQQGLNVLEASAEYSMDQRFSEYHAFKQSTDSFADLRNATSIDGNELVVITDPGMGGFKRPDGQSRIRKMAIITEQMDNNGQFAETRARWEMARRFGRSQAVRVTVDSWRDSKGKLWEPNYKVRVQMPAWKFEDVEFVIGEVSYLRDTRGTRANLVLMPPDAYKPEPVILAPFDAQIRRDLDGGGNGASGAVPPSSDHGQA